MRLHMASLKRRSAVSDGKTLGECIRNLVAGVDVNLQCACMDYLLLVCPAVVF
jgi:hypothetical protein